MSPVSIYSANEIRLKRFTLREAANRVYNRSEYLSKGRSYYQADSQVDNFCHSVGYYQQPVGS